LQDKRKRTAISTSSSAISMSGVLATAVTGLAGAGSGFGIFGENNPPIS
jgi:hypothetical protein